MRRWGVLLLAALAAGCSGLFRSSARPEQVYYLRAPPVAATPAAAGVAGGAGVAATAADGAASALPLTQASIRIGHPVVDPGLDSPHILLVEPDHRMNFYTGARWPAALPEVLEMLTVETLGTSGAWVAVVDSTSPFPASYLLQITVRRFEAEYGGGGAPVVHVTLDCIIGRREGREVIATFVTSASAPAAANRLSDVVAAFEQATSEALGSLSLRTAEAVRADQSRAAHDGQQPATPGGR